MLPKDFPGWLNSKRICLQCRSCGRHGFDSWVGKIPWRKAWLPTPVSLPRESRGQRSLVGCRLWSQSRTRLKRLSSSKHSLFISKTLQIFVKPLNLANKSHLWWYLHFSLCLLRCEFPPIGSSESPLSEFSLREEVPCAHRLLVYCTVFT